MPQDQYPHPCAEDYHPVTLTLSIMKYFVRLVIRHIKTLLPSSLDPMQFAYHPNCSTDDAIAISLHLALKLLDKKYTYV
ncbi:hypothetical protein QTP86_007351 [Hemibagrus guttatus]|nr:hypothetical protein QTP86_007351 [Hemibagrus guttatus]